MGKSRVIGQRRRLLSSPTVLDVELSLSEPGIGKVLFETRDVPLLLFVDPSESGDLCCLFSAVCSLSRFA